MMSMRHLLLFLYFFGLTGMAGLSAQEIGLAGVYDDKFHGRRTAYQYTYDKNKLTACHKKHPAGARLKVTRLDNNQSVTVTVNDKGPYVFGQIIKLSKAAAQAIGMLDEGVTRVKVEVVGTEDLARTNTNANTRSANSDPPGRRTTSEEEEDQRPVTTYDNTQNTVTNNTNRNANTTSNTSNEDNTTERRTATTVTPSTIEVTAKSPDTEELAGREYEKYGLHKMKVSRPDPQGFGVQVMALNSYEQVFPQIAKYQSRGFKNIYLNIDPVQPSYPYKLMLGLYDNEDSAKQYARALQSNYNIKGFVTGEEFAGYLFKINLLKPSVEGYGVQVMSLSSYENVLDQLAEFERRGFNDIYIKVEQGQQGSNYKILLGMFDNPDSANRYKNDLRRKYSVNGFVINAGEEN